MNGGFVWKPRVPDGYHDEVVPRISALAAKLNYEAVARSFVANFNDGSSVSGQVILGSAAFLRHFVTHRSIKVLSDHACAICGISDAQPIITPEELSEWRARGGGSSFDIEYHAYDVERFLAALEYQAPTQAAIQNFNDILMTLAMLDHSAGVKKAVVALKPVIKRQERPRQTLLEAFGVCGFLESPKHKGFKDCFVPYDKRSQVDDFPSTSGHVAYPACWWRRKYGFNIDALEKACLLPYVFPSVLELLREAHDDSLT